MFCLDSTSIFFISAPSSFPATSPSNTKTPPEPLHLLQILFLYRQASAKSTFVFLFFQPHKEQQPKHINKYPLYHTCNYHITSATITTSNQQLTSITNNHKPKPQYPSVENLLTMLMCEQRADDHTVPHLPQMDLDHGDTSQDDVKYVEDNLAKPVLRTNSDTFTKHISQLLDSNSPSYDNSTQSQLYLELMDESETPPAFSKSQSQAATDSFRLLQVNDLITPPIAPPIVPASTRAPIVPASLPNFAINSGNTRRSATRDRPSATRTRPSSQSGYVSASKSPKSDSKCNIMNSDDDSDEFELSPSPACPSSPNHTVGKRSLPPQHKPARGRGRKHQLKHMTPEQIEEEAHDRAEKNRLAAKECRVRRKNREATLRDQVQRLQHTEAESQKKIKQLLAKVKFLESRGLQ